MKKFIACMFIGFIMFAVTASAQTQTVETKKGWSQKKKGAVIGAAVGAGTGAIVSRRKGRGAVIGGAAGAGVGYAYGRHRQKKHPKTTVKRKIVTRN